MLKKKKNQIGSFLTDFFQKKKSDIFFYYYLLRNPMLKRAGFVITFSEKFLSSRQIFTNIPTPYEKFDPRKMQPIFFSKTNKKKKNRKKKSDFFGFFDLTKKKAKKKGQVLFPNRWSCVP